MQVPLFISLHRIFFFPYALVLVCAAGPIKGSSNKSALKLAKLASITPSKCIYLAVICWFPCIACPFVVRSVLIIAFSHWNNVTFSYAYACPSAFVQAYLASRMHLIFKVAFQSRIFQFSTLSCFSRDRLGFMMLFCVLPSILCFLL